MVLGNEIPEWHLVLFIHGGQQCNDVAIICDIRALLQVRSCFMYWVSNGPWADLQIQKCVEESHKLVDSLDNLRVSAGSSSSSFKKKPVIIIVVGMAGSGKTSFLHRLVCHTFDSIMRGYVLNLVPAVMSLPFGANIDIRDTVRYKEVMKQYNLGPNGGIMTSLNLNVQLDYVLVDTPGQIEIFTWSASGAIITEAFASTFPTVVTYVVDTPRSTSPITFMSNMLYKTRLPLVLAFNKTDGADHKFALEWMEDFEVFQAAIPSDNSYTSTLANSLSLSLYEFYRNIRSVGVSAITGAGMDDFFKAIEASSMLMICVFLFFRADLDKRKVEKEQLEEERREKEMEKLRKDIESSQGRTVKDDDEDFQIEEDSDGAIDEDDEDEEMNRFYRFCTKYAFIYAQRGKHINVSRTREKTNKNFHIIHNQESMNVYTMVPLT
ncbi:hypothetical protein YC2023_043030 [Brassica napus]